VLGEKHSVYREELHKEKKINITIKLLEGKAGENLDDLCSGNDILDTTQSTNKRIDTLDIIKIKVVYSAKINVKKMRRQALTLGENICKRNI